MPLLHRHDTAGMKSFAKEMMTLSRSTLPWSGSPALSIQVVSHFHRSLTKARLADFLYSGMTVMFTVVDKMINDHRMRSLLVEVGNTEH